MMFSKKALFFTLAVVTLSAFVSANAEFHTSVIGFDAFDDVERFLMEDGNHTSSDDGNYTSSDDEHSDSHDEEHDSHKGHDHSHDGEHSSDESGAASFRLVGSAIAGAFVAAAL